MRGPPPACTQVACAFYTFLYKNRLNGVSTPRPCRGPDDSDAPVAALRPAPPASLNSARSSSAARSRHGPLPGLAAAGTPLWPSSASHPLRPWRLTAGRSDAAPPPPADRRDPAGLTQSPSGPFRSVPARTQSRGCEQRAAGGPAARAQGSGAAAGRRSSAARATWSDGYRQPGSRSAATSPSAGGSSTRATPTGPATRM